MINTALRWGAGLAATGYATSRLLGDSAHRARILGSGVAHAAKSEEVSHSTVAPTPAPNSAPMQLKKLHVYDHCPFCVRVQLVAGWRGLPHEVVVYGYGDCEGPKKLLGKKVLPVMEFTSETGETNYMMESSDIIEALETVNPETNRNLSQPTRRDIATWIKKSKSTKNILTRGPQLKLPIKDFATVEDIQYSVNKYAGPRFGFDYVKAIEKAPAAIEEMEGYLAELDGMIHSEGSVNPWGRSMDDLVLLPVLRTLSLVKNLKWPAKVKNYLDKGCADAGLETYTAVAVHVGPEV